MKPKRLLRSICVIGFLALAPAILSGQVQIIRQPPPSDDEPGQATWSKPYSDPAQARETGQADLSGRISVGGQGGQDKAGDALYNLSSDSLISLVQPLGGDAILSLDATVVRLQSAVKEDQRYDGTLALEFERLQFETSGGFSQTLNEAADIDSTDADARFGLSVSSGLIETLPMSLEYRSVWVNREELSVETESSRSDELAFKSVGTVGNVGLDVRGDLEYEDDREDRSESLGTAGNITATFPMGEQLALLLNLKPIYNRSETQTSELRSTSLESGTGLSWLPQEDLEANLRVSRVDAWSSGEGAVYEAYQNSWKGGVGADYLPRQGFFAGPSYDFTKAVGGNASHDLVLLLGWWGEEIVRELSGRSASTFIRTEGGSRVKDTYDWQLQAALLPAERMSLDGEYQGGYVSEEAGDSWNHELGTEFSHTPDPGLTYRGSATLSNIREDGAEPLREQQYLAALTVKPLINYVQYTVDLSETLDLSSGSSGDDVLSSALTRLAFPLGSELKGRVGFEWEWINRTSIGAEAGNYFHYSAGISVAGKTAPFSMTADYVLAHGYRGLRHDFNSGIQVPLQGGYALDSDFTLSSYEESNESKLYWVLSLNLVYSF